MSIVNKLADLVSRKSFLVALVTIVILAAIISLTSGDGSSADTQSHTKPTVVTLTSALEYAGGDSLSLIGSVRAASEASVTNERAGRVTSVPVRLGQSVPAGAVVATFENASERAAVLQAEGAYEATLAAASQSSLSVDEANTALTAAKRSTVSTLQSAFNTTNGVVVSNIDDYFSQPNSPLPGLRVGGQGYTAFLNNERVAYQDLLPEWQSRVTALTIDDDLSSEIAYTKANVQRTIKLVETFLYIFDKNGDEKYADDEVTYTGLRNSLISLSNSLDAAQSSLESATDVVRRAEQAATGGTASAADAQVKQALGSLKAAQANLAKTILRTPIAGTVNSLSVRTGDFVGSFQTVAVIANNNALEIVTYVSEQERSLIAIGDTVDVENTFKGTITSISPAVDPNTRKIEVRIASEAVELVPGDTVRVTKTVDSDTKTSDVITVPVAAVKFERENGYVFVVEDNKLVARPVILGVLRGGSVEVLEGISASEQFVNDARGLIAGTTVTISD